MDSNFLLGHNDAINLTLDKSNLGHFVLAYVH